MSTTRRQHNEDVRRGLKAKLTPSDAAFILGEAVAHLAPIAGLRNPAAHSSHVTRAEVSKLREQVLGVGQDGLICRIARVKM